MDPRNFLLVEMSSIIWTNFCSEVESRELNLTFPVMLNPVTWDAHLFPVYFGGSVITEDLTIDTVPAVQLAYFIAADNKRQDAM